MEMTVATRLKHAWNTFMNRDSYVSAVEQRGDLTEEDVTWIEWVKQKADWYDPTIKRKDEFFGTREHDKSKDQKKLEKSYYSWRW